MPRPKRSSALSFPEARSASKRCAGSMPFTVSWPGRAARTRAPAQPPFPRTARPPLEETSMLRMLRIATIAFLAALVPSAGAKEREVAIGLQAGITSIDPHYHNLSPNNSLLLHIYEPLVYRDPDGKLVPALATSWRALDDLTWEFKMRKNVKFHDGTPFTAQDVVATYKR